MCDCPVTRCLFQENDRNLLVQQPNAVIFLKWTIQHGAKTTKSLVQQNYRNFLVGLLNGYHEEAHELFWNWNQYRRYETIHGTRYCKMTGRNLLISEFH